MIIINDQSHSGRVKDRQNNCWHRPEIARAFYSCLSGAFVRQRHVKFTSVKKPKMRTASESTTVELCAQ